MDKPPLAEQKEIKEIGTKKNKKGNNKYPYIASLGFGQTMGRYVVCNHQIILPRYRYAIKAKNKARKKAYFSIVLFMNLYMTKETIIHGARTAIPPIIKTFVCIKICRLSDR